jgi:hypothetical protein
MMVRPETSPPATAAQTAEVRLAVVGDGGTYAMFEVDAVDGAGARVRGPVLLEIGEEIPLRLSRGGASADVRARVTRHEQVGDDTATVLVFVDGETEARRLLGG